MKLSQPSVLGKNDFPGENENFYSLLSYSQQFSLEVRDLASNRISFDDNIDNQLIIYDFTDLVPGVFKNKLNHKPNEIVSATAIGQMVVGTQFEFLQSGQVSITLKFANAGAKASCRVRII